MAEIVKRVCHLCEAMCGVTIEKTEAAQIRGNRDDVFSKGAFCPKSQGLRDLHFDPDRLRQPLKRVGATFVPVSWEEAWEDIGRRITALQKQYGRRTMATYAGNPNAHNTGNLLALPFFLKALRSPNQFSATSVDQLPHMLVAYQMFGHQLLLPIADVDHTDYMLILGANPAVSGGSLLSAAGLSSRIKAIKEREGKVIVLDPRYTETASLASEHHYIRPGTDAFLLAALVHLLLTRHPKADARLAPLLKAEPELLAVFKSIDLKAAAEVSGVSLSVIEGIAADLSRYPKAICYGRMGVSTQSYGTVCQWLINLINILTGNFDRRGGVLFTRPAFDVHTLMAKIGSRGSFARRRSRVRQLPEFSGEFPSATLADEILTPGDGQVRGLITVAGNPVLSLPNGRKLEKALAELDLYVAIDIYQNETTRHAHYILPPSSSLEHSHFDLVFNALAARNIVRYSPPVFDPPPGALEDWEILVELWARIGLDVKAWQRPLRKGAAWIIRRFGPDAVIDWQLRRGPYPGLSLKKLRQNPDGIDLGPLAPSLPERLFTRDKKINLTPPVLLEAWEQFRSDPLWQMQTNDRDSFYLIGRRNLKSNNSWMHNLPSLHRSKDPCFAIMHPSDAARYGIEQGAQIKLSTEVGSIELPVSLSPRIMPGVISVPHGWGHHRAGTKLNLASKQAGVSLNDIVDDSQVDALSGNAILNGQRVRVSLSDPSSRAASVSHAPALDH